jgi:hypothetical protein
LISRDSSSVLLCIRDPEARCIDRGFRGWDSNSGLYSTLHTHFPTSLYLILILCPTASVVEETSLNSKLNSGTLKCEVLTGGSVKITVFGMGRLVYLSISLQPFVGHWPLFSFLILYIDSRTPWTVDQPIAHTGQHKENKRTQTSIPQVGFEPKIPVFERRKTVHALDRTATVIGVTRCSLIYLLTFRRNA